MADLLPNDPNNVAPQYFERSQSAQLQEKLKAAKMYAADTPLPQAKQTAQPEEDPTDPLGIRIAKDIGLGAIEAIPQVVGGAADAVNETLQAMDSLANWLNENVADLGDSTKPGEGFQLPTTDKAKSTTGGLVRSASQFLTGFVPALRATKAMTGGAAVSAAGKFAQSSAAGGFADAFVFDPHEERLSNMIEQFPALSNPVTQYLAADPNDGELEGRFKNFLEGLGLGTLTEGVYEGIKAIRANRIATGTQPPKLQDVEGVADSIMVNSASIGKAHPDYGALQAQVKKALASEDFTTNISTKDGQPVKLIDIEDDTGASRILAFDDKGNQIGSLEYTKSADYNGKAIGVVSGVNENWRRKGVASAMYDLAEKKGGVLPKADDAAQMRSEDAKAFHEGRTPGTTKFLVKRQAGSMLPPSAPFETALVKSDPKRAFITDPAVAAKAAEGKATPSDLAKSLDFSQLNTPEMIQKAVNRFAKLSSEANDLAKSKALNQGRPSVVSDKEIKKLADDLNMTPEQIMGNQAFLKGNKALDAERIHAASKLLEAAQIKVTELADKATTSTDQKDLFDFVKMMHIHSAVQQYFKGASSEAGRALRALQIPNGSVAKQLSMLNEALTGVGGDAGVRRVAEAVKKVRGNKRALNQVLERGFSKKASDTVVSLWYFNLLSGLKTHAANVLSTGLNAAWQIPERYLASKISALRGTSDGVAEGEAAQLMYGYINSFKDGLRASWDVIKTGEQKDLLAGKMDRPEPRVRAVSGQSYGFANAPEGDPRWFMGKAFDALGIFLDAPTRAIMAEDEFFRVMGKSGEMHALAFRQAASEGLEGDAMAKRMLEIMENPSQEMLEKVDTFMRDLTFSAPLGRFGQAAMALTNAHPVLKLAVPFIRTPVNLLKAAGRRNFITGPFMESVRADMRKGGAAKDLAIARMALGSMVSLVVMDQVLSGNITGAGPSGYGDKALQNAWRVNKQPFSIKIGDKWYSYNRADPLGTMLGAVATYTELAAQVDNDTAEELAASVAIATSQTVFNKTWMKGPAELLEALTQPDRYGEKYITQMMGTLFVGQGVAQITQTIDPTWREVNSIMDAVKSRVPGLSETLPPRRNLWGQPIHMEGGLGPDVISPVYTMTDKHDAISQYITDNKVSLDLPTRTQLNVELTPHEYSEFVQRSGEPAHAKLTAIMEGRDSLSEQWRNGTDGPDGSRALIVRTVIQSYRDAARAQMLKESPDLQRRVRLFNEEKVNALRGR